MLRVPCLLLATAALSAPAFGADVEVLPAVSVHLEAARYAPSERDLRWTTWIGAGATALRVGSWTFFGNADLETILGDELRTFDATQANYHLALGARVPLGPLVLSPFFHHVSRHHVDRPKQRAVDWNVLGLRLSGQTRPGGVPVRFGASLGRTTQASLPGYEWEVRAAAEGRVWQQGSGSALVRGALRLVTVREEDTLPRGDFADWTLEGALRWERGGRALEAFLSAEKRNDVFLEVPGSRQRALLGLRVLLDREAPTSTP
jgi:hypothetical protein